MLNDLLGGELAGVVVGGTLGVVGTVCAQFINHRLTRGYERTKSLNLALNNLLELHFLAEYALNTDIERIAVDAVEIVLKELKATEDVIDSMKQEASAQGALFALLKQKVEAELDYVDSDYLQSAFKEAVHELAKVEPVLAFRISRRNEWKKCLEQGSAHAKDVLQTLDVGDDVKNLVEDFGSTKVQQVKNDMLQTLRHDVRSVGWLLGPVQYIRVLLHVRNVKKATNSEQQAKELAKECKAVIKLALTLVPTAKSAKPKESSASTSTEGVA